jgi:hypothetical protein
MSEAPHRIRLSPVLRALVSRVSPNVSAAHRALLLLGAHAAGYDVAPCRADTARVLSEELDERVAQAIEGLLSDRRSAVGTTSYTWPTEPQSQPPTLADTGALEHDDTTPANDSPGDPFAGIGIDV